MTWRAFLASGATALACALPCTRAKAQPQPESLPIVVPRPGLVIQRSVRLKPGIYRLRAPASTDSALLVVRGDHITVDMRGVSLVGMDESADPDQAAGVALRVDGGSDVTICGARIRGYRIAVLARGTRQLRVVDNDVSYNWKPRLYSLVEHESLVDWLSFHHNEQREWLRFGAALYLEDVHGGEIRGNRAEQGMNALLLVRSDSLRVWNNVFSFNSGLGIGLYRSSDDSIMHNQVDYDVRGYSDRFYHRGQDSAGILVYEQSCRNVVAYNSVTHGGDGLFLWAGQSTMDSGTGGADDNLFYRNDFSFAPANGMEATFSRNRFIANTVTGNDYGLWGGYSHDSEVLYNWFGRNRTGIAIEHGQSNRIVGNVFSDDTTAISLFANPVEPSDWGYPKHHDTRSHGYVIGSNVIDGARAALRIANTSDVAVRDNTFIAVDSLQVPRDTTRFTLANRVLRSLPPGVTVATSLPDSLARRMPLPLAGAMDVQSPLAGAPRSAIIVDEWGPYDYRSPRLWPLDSTHAVPLRLAVLGPPGTWTLEHARGIARLSRTSGRIPAAAAADTISVTPRADSSGSWAITLRYTGAATTTPRGQERGAGAPVTASYVRDEPRMDWTVRWFAWSDSTDPRSHAAGFDHLLRGTPLLVQQRSRLDYEGYGRVSSPLPADSVAMEATAQLNLAPGAYALRVISDDAVRVWVDDTLAIDHWAPHESTVDEAPLQGGRHTLRVRYYQLDGWYELRLEVLRGEAPRSLRPASASP